MADIIGDDEGNSLDGTDEADFLWGMGGFDQLHGLGGDDLYLLTDAFALVGFDLVIEAAGGGNDSVIVQMAAAPGGLGLTYTLAPNVENGTIGGVDTLPPEVQTQPPDAPFTLIGNALGNVLSGNRAANTLEGRDGADTLDGKGGLDSLIGGAGDDFYLLLDVTEPVISPAAGLALPPIGALDPFYDGVTEAAGGGTDTVLVVRVATVTNAPTSYTLGANVENGLIGGVDFGQASDLAFSLTGNELDNSLTGNRADNTLVGNAGNDALSGGAGFDTLFGGAGNDTYLLLDVTFPVIGAAAAAQLLVGPSYDTVTEAAGGGNDTIIVDLVPGADTPRSYTLGANIENGMVAGVATGQTSDLPLELIGNVLDNSLTGNNAGTTLRGGAGNDVLDGRLGLDTLIGGSGDDIYLVLDGTITLVGLPIPQFATFYDTVTEAAGGGTDTVIVTRADGIPQPLTSYTLTANVENGIIGGLDSGLASDLPFTLSGNELDNSLLGNREGNTLNGNGGADFLNGGTNIDTLVGGAGDDFYLVLDATTTLVGQPIPSFVTVYDTVTEAAGGGIDTVIVARAVALQALTFYRLTANVENGIIGGVDFGQATDAAFKLTGNALANTLIGNRADNTLNGDAGADSMAGGAGNDAYYVDNALDQVQEAAGAGIDVVRASVDWTLAAGQEVETLRVDGALGRTLGGNELANQLFGGTGNDTLNGGAGNDQLSGGGGGGNIFRFDTALGATNIDTIAGYNVAADTIQLDNAVFTGLPLGTLAPGAFVTGTAAGAADDRIIYNAATGALFFDANGNAAGQTFRFATLAPGLALTNADFVVI